LMIQGSDPLFLIFPEFGLVSRGSLSVYASLPVGLGGARRGNVAFALHSGKRGRYERKKRGTAP
jgi:hypothetical protein